MRILFTFYLLLISTGLFAQDFYVKFPDDIVTENCQLNQAFGAPIIYNPSGLNITVDYTDAVFTIVPDACTLIERNWIIKGPNYNPNLGCITIYNPKPNSIVNHPDNLPGPIVSAPGTAAPWAPTLVKILPTDPSPTDYSIFWSAGPNCYEYKQLIKFVDFKAPALLNCSSPGPTFADLSLNDPLLWNARQWYDPVTESYDRLEGEVDLSISATDDCYGSNLEFRYLLFLDFNNDGVMESVVDSRNMPPQGQIRYDNVFTPSFLGGVLRTFDQRDIPVKNKYAFALELEQANNIKKASVRWATLEGTNIKYVNPQLPPGTHKVKWIVTDGCGNESICEYTFKIQHFNPTSVRLLTGVFKSDQNLNCQNDASDPVLNTGWRARLDYLRSDGATYATTFSMLSYEGKYQFLVDTGQYRLSAEPPNTYWSLCQLDTLLNVTQTGDTSTIDFLADKKVDCPFLETDIGIWGLRRCFDNTYTVRYCNTGTVAAQDAYVTVKLDPFMSFISAGLPGTYLGDDTWKFNIGNVPAGRCDQFPLTVNIDCDSTIIGQTHCVEAHIYPDTFCLPPTLWSGANVELNGRCNTDSLRFVLKNTGPVPTQNLEYIVIEDIIINRKGPFQLGPQDSMIIKVPANGSTWRLEAEQEPGNPVNQFPSVTIEACGQNSQGSISIGFLSQFGEDDGDPFVSVDCQDNRGSYDPNDKKGFPLGYGADHLIPPGQPLEYLIRFQNTGTDTAFRVIIRDTLSKWLDPRSLRPGVASHPYRFELGQDGAMAFIFNQIMLPDSNVNEPASHGFVKFSVQQQPNTPLNTLILNEAAIYFDFNAPIITNQTRHKVGINFVKSDVLNPSKSGHYAPLTLSPNPATTPAAFWLSGVELRNGQFELYDGLGRLLLRQNTFGQRIDLPQNKLTRGIYLFKVYEKGQFVGAGKVVVE